MENYISDITCPMNTFSLQYVHMVQEFSNVINFRKVLIITILFILKERRLLYNYGLEVAYLLETFICYRNLFWRNIDVKKSSAIILTEHDLTQTVNISVLKQLTLF